MGEKELNSSVVEEKETTEVSKSEESKEEVVGTSNVDSEDNKTTSEEVKTEVVDEKEKKKNKILNIVETVVEAIIVVIAVVFSIFAIANPGGMNSDYSKINVNMLPVLSNSMSGTFEEGDLIFGNKAERNSEGKNETVYDVGTVAIFVVNDYNSSKNQYLNTHRIIGYQYTWTNLGPTYYETLIDENITTAEQAYKYAEDNNINGFSIYGYITKGDNYEIYKTADNDSTYKTNAVHDTYVVPLNNVVGTWNGEKVAGLGAVITWVKTPLNFFLVIMIPLILLFGWNVFTVVKYFINQNKEKQKLALEAAANKSYELSEEEKEEIKRRAVEEYMKKLQEEQQNKEDK